MNRLTAFSARPSLARIARRNAAWLRGAPWAALVLMGLTIILSRALWWGNPIADIDEQLYSFIGWRMLHGELPYVAWWDRKPFGLFAIFAAAHAIGGPGALAYQIVAALAVFAGALLVFKLARALVDRVSAAFASMLYIILMAAYASHSAQSEVFHVPLVLAMAVLVADQRRGDALRRAHAAMLLGGLALQVKYTVVAQCVFLGLWALWGLWQRERNLPKVCVMAGTFALLGLLPTVLVAALYAAIGQWDAFWFANFVSFFDRAAAPAGRFNADHVVFLLPVACLLCLGSYTAARLAPPSSLRHYMFFAGLFLSSVATAFLPATVYPYYFAAIVPGAILLALPLINRTGPLHLAPGIILIVLAMSLLSLPERWHASRTMQADLIRFTAAASAHVGPETCLYVYDGPTVLYRLTNSCVPSRFVYPDHLNNALEEKALGVDQAGELARILKTRPGAIVTAKVPLTPQNPQSKRLIETALASNYQIHSTADIHGREQTLWVRKN